MHHQPKVLTTHITHGFSHIYSNSAQKKKKNAACEYRQVQA